MKATEMHKIAKDHEVDEMEFHYLIQAMMNLAKEGKFYYYRTELSVGLKNKLRELGYTVIVRTDMNKMPHAVTYMISWENPNESI